MMLVTPLHAWLVRHGDVRHARIAEYLGVHVVTVCFWRIGRRSPTIAHQQQLERMTRHYDADPVTLEQWSAYRAAKAKASVRDPDLRCAA